MICLRARVTSGIKEIALQPLDLSNDSFSGPRLTHFNRSTNEVHDVQGEIRMDPRGTDAMSPQYLGGDALPAAFLGRGADRCR